MSLFQRLTDKYIVTPVAKRITSIVTGKETKIPNVFQVPIGYNTQNIDTNRRQAGVPVSFSTLRQISISHETTRAAINVRKRQINQLKWEVVDIYPDRGKSYTDEVRHGVEDMMLNIGGPGVKLREILDKLIEDTLVLDACVFYKQRTVGGKLLRIIPVDGATIKLKVDESGMRPLLPEFAFEQWIMGRKVAEMTTDELVYQSMNPRTTSPYGLSPLESLILIIDASFRATLYNTNYLSDTNVPQGFLTMPEEWTPEQIKEYYEYFNAMISSPKDQVKLFPVPANTQYQATSRPKDFQFKDFFDYLDRKVAMLFDVTPQELGLSLQQYKENADSQERIQMRKGLRPLARFIEEIFTDVVAADLGFAELGFRFAGLESRYTTDEADLLVKDGVISIDDVRADMGMTPLGVPNFILAGNSITPISEIGMALVTVSGTNTQVAPVPTTETQVKSAKSDFENDLKLWESKVLKDVKNKGKVYREFESDFIPKSIKTIISGQLKKCEAVEQVRDIFKRKGKRVENPLMVAEADEKFSKYKQMIKKALLKQITPFTKATTIEQLNKMEKDEEDDLDSGVSDILDSVEITGLTEMLTWAVGIGGDTASKQIGISTMFKPSKVFAEKLGDRENYIIDSVDNTTKDWIISRIKQGKEMQMTNDEIAKKISDEYDDISQSRAEMILNTEVANAVQQGELSVYADQGIERKMWVTSEDDLVEPECADLDGEIVGIDENFSSGDDAPPLHPNCRCYIQAVIE